MALLPEVLDFTDLDFESIRLRLQQLARQVFPTWTDFNTANFGNILLESFAHAGGILAGLQDNQANEGKIVSARLRKSMIALAKQFAFELPGAVAATVDVKFSIPAIIANNIDIAAGTIITTNDPVPVLFQTIALGTITAGATEVTISAEQAETKQDTGFGDGTPDQELTLTFFPFLDDSAALDIGGDTFIEVDNFLSSGPTDKHFVVKVDEDDIGTIVFGDGQNGVAASGVITVNYKIGGGTVGNVEAGSITKLDGTFFDVLSNQVALAATNVLAAAGGIDRMTVAEARIAIPDSIRATGSRSVGREDFEINARKTRGVARALMLTADQDATIAENTGKLFIVPVGGGLPSSALKTSVLNSINDVFPPCATFTLTVEDPGLKVIAITADVFLKTGAVAATVKQAILDALDAFFNPLNADNTPNTDVDFGFNIRTTIGGATGEIPFTDLINIVRDVDGVRKVDEDTFIPADDVTLLDSEFPVLGVVTLVNGDTMAPL